MESDRLSTQDALVKERERVQKLRDEIDAQAYKRMHDLPLAVQRGKGNGYLPRCYCTYQLFMYMYVLNYRYYDVKGKYQAKVEFPRVWEYNTNFPLEVLGFSLSTSHQLKKLLTSIIYFSVK